MANDVDRLAGLLALDDVAAARSLTDSLEQDNPAVAAIARGALDAAPDDPARKLQIATLYIIAGRRDQAIACALEALTPGVSPAIRTSVATIYLAAERFGEARELLQAVIAEEPDHREAHLNLAAAAFRLGDVGAAMSGYARAFDLDPMDLTPIHNLVEMFAEMGKWLGALGALDMSRRGEPPPEVAVALDLAALEVTQLAASMFPAAGIDTRSDKVVRDLVSNVTHRGLRSQLVVARALIDVGRFAEATVLVQRLGTVTTLDPGEQADVYYLQGLLAEHARKRDVAVDYYMKAIAADAKRADAATNALSLLIAHGTPHALAQIEPLLASLDPNARAASPTLAFNEARYIHKSARPAADARACLDRVLQLTGGTGDLADLAREAIVDMERT